MQATLDALRTDQRSLDLALALVSAGRPADARIVLVVDQFEEVFTLCDDETERQAFFDNLLYAARVPGGRCTVVVTMRADFYPRCSAYPDLAQQFSRDHYLVSPLGTDGLRAAIAEPAARVGLEFEAGLVATILDDVENEPGALPLLEHALLELWQQRAGQMLTLEAYRRVGGVSGALARRAELIYDRLDEPQREALRRTMLRLTQPGDGAEDTRRRSTMNELEGDVASAPDVQRVIQILVDARLLTVGGDSTGARTVDVAHEALIRGWPRLRGWIDADRAGLREHRRITEAAQEWERLGRDESALYRGARLATAEEWRSHYDTALNALEREFLNTSAARARQERRAARRRTRQIIAGLSLGLLLTTSLAVVALLQRESAQSSDQRALAASRYAFAQQLSERARALFSSDPELGLRLALEAVKIQANEISTQTLREALLRIPLASTIPDHGGVATPGALSRDGTRLALAREGGVDIWEPLTGQQIATLALPSDAPLMLEFSPDGRYLAIGAVGGGVILWDTANGTSRALTSSGAAISGLQFSADGRLLLSLHSTDGARLWHVADGAAATVIASDAQLGTLADADRLVITSDTLGNTSAWDAATGAHVARLPAEGGTLTGLLAAPGRAQVVLLTAFDPIRVWDVRSGTVLRPAGMLGELRAHDGAISADGKWLALAGRFGFTGVWDIETWTRVSAAPGGTLLTLRAYISETGDAAAVLASDGRIHLWSTDAPQTTAELLTPDWNIGNVTLNAAQQRIVITSLTGEVLLFSYAAIDAPSDQLRALAEARQPRALTMQERITYLHEGVGE